MCRKLSAVSKITHQGTPKSRPGMVFFWTLACFWPEWSSPAMSFKGDTLRRRSLVSWPSAMNDPILSNYLDQPRNTHLSENLIRCPLKWPCSFTIFLRSMRSPLDCFYSVLYRFKPRSLSWQILLLRRRTDFVNLLFALSVTHLTFQRTGCQACMINTKWSPIGFDSSFLKVAQ